MSALILRNRFHGNTTTIENEFIDNYMAKANGEYVKVYLLLLRHLNAQDTMLSTSKLADCLECTEKDIQRAFKYWAKVGLLNLDYNEDGTICGVSLESVTPTTAPSRPTTSERKPSHTAASTTKATLKQLYFVAEQYMGKTLSATDLQRINYFYDELHFSMDLIEYLIEYCVENGHKSMRYIETVALSWADENITTVAEAKEKVSLYNKDYYAVLKAFGITGRNPAAIEVRYIHKWLNEYGFTLDIILEACNRTIANTSKADFKYADTILKNWFASEVHHLADIQRLDFAHQHGKDSAKRATARTTSTTKRFNNFENRPYDMQSLEQKLLNTQ